uniref:Ig-like domain-containing protein n=1 Tax=Maylandia zebra TaxID=106582 RepID=A0A3P9BN67_9CICH
MTYIMLVITILWVQLCASALVQEQCAKGYCINLTEQELTAEAGLCVVILCSFTTGVGFTPKHIVWYKCEASQHRCSEPDIIFHSNKNTDKKAQSGFEGQVSRLEPDVSQNNCSIIINDLEESDSGSYQLRVTGVLNGKQDGFTFIPRVTKPTVMSPTLTEGQQATLTCTAPGFCSGSNLVDFTQRHISTLTFNPSAEHHNTSVTCKINFTGGKSTEETLTVHVNCEYFNILDNNRAAQIIGNTTVKEGDVLNLTCSAESFPPSVIVWSKLSSNTKLHNDTGSATLVVHNVTSEHSGQYICTVKHLDTTLNSYVDRVLFYDSDYIEGFPLPNIKWPLLNHHTEYSVITSVSNHTVNSTVSLTVKNHGNSTVECVSNNGNGEVRENLKAARMRESTKTEYAEIKKVIKKEQEDDGGDDGKMLEGEMKHCETEKKDEEDEAVYSTVNDITDDI